MKRRRDITPRWLYCRPGVATVYARDAEGRYICFRINGGDVRLLPGGITTLGPIYGRVNFANAVRFNGRTRSQTVLAARFLNIPVGNQLTTGFNPLPQTREKVRRQTNQGMDPAMIALTGQARSATGYVTWFDGLHPNFRLQVNERWEWCHLLAASMGGANDQTNIVAARRGNNSEQLAIESALQMYRCEQIFQMDISVGCLIGGHGIHIGDVIKYEVSSSLGGANFVYYLDCLNAPDPSQIHYYDLLRRVAAWANHILANASEQIHGRILTRTDRNLVLDYI